MEDATSPDQASDPAQEQEWVRQNNLAYVALMGVGLVIVQPFLTAGPLDTSAKVCVLGFAVAFPLLAGLVMLSRQELFRGRMSRSLLVNVAKSLGQFAAFVGLVAGFWHIWWIAGVAMLISTVVATGVHSAGFVGLEPAKRWPSVRG